MAAANKNFIKVVQHQPLKVFVNDINTFLSQSIVEELRNDHIAYDSDSISEHKFYGTPSSSENAPMPQGIHKIIPKTRKKQVYEHILSSDVVIFDLNFGSTDDVDQIAKLIREQPSSVNKDMTFIVLSSVMSWAGSDPKTPKEDDALNTDDEDLSEDEKERKYTTDFTDEDFE